MTTTTLRPFDAAMFQAFSGVESSNPLFATASNPANDEVTLILDGTVVEVYLINVDGSDSIWTKDYPEGDATAECVALGLLRNFEQCENNGQIIAVLERFAFQSI